MRKLSEIVEGARFTTRTLHCHGCENNCNVIRYDFGSGQPYYSGNRCEKVFNNGAATTLKGLNAYKIKEELLFSRAQEKPAQSSDGRIIIGIPRVLGLYEDFPFWYSLFSECGFRVVLSSASDYRRYEQTAGMVMSDNICFPAKLVHSHIDNLIHRKVDRIFFPYVVYGPKGEDQNSYNCPVVTGYPEVVRNVQSTSGIPLDTPVFSMKDNKLFLKECTAYLATLGVESDMVSKAFRSALSAAGQFSADMAAACWDILDKSQGMTILLAGRPYHTDPLIQHQVSDMIAQMGVNVITDDIVRGSTLELSETNFLPQWTYTNRILRAARWASLQGPDVQFVELTSFGCGPDAFLTDSVRDLLMLHGKSLTLLKLDDINNVGSMKLRVRSLIESLKLSVGNTQKRKPFRTTPAFRKEDRSRTILAPFFTPFASPLIPALFHTEGFNVVNLPLSDERSADIGLRYANNEVCYPATLVVGDIIKALQSGEYDPDNTAVAITQTGGQCRASNYMSLIRKALSDAGYGQVPVISVSLGSGISNEQPGFRINWLKLLPQALYCILFSDSLSKFYYATIIREKEKGAANALKERYLETAAKLVENREWRKLLPLTAQAAADFESVCTDRNTKKVGIVGEIYLKFNPFAHRHITDWLSEHDVEVAYPTLLEFFIQYFVNRKTNKRSNIETSSIPEFIYNWFYSRVRRSIDRFNEAASAFSRFRPSSDLFEQAERASHIVTLNAQFGEGWLLPGEIATYAEEGIPNVLSLQPFGCIANHIVARGVEKKIKQLYPDLNYLAIDFDGGVSEVNITNRMLLFLDSLK